MPDRPASLTRIFATTSIALLAGVVPASGGLPSQTLSAQVVQPIEPEQSDEVRRLNRALQRLASNPRNVDALNDAGDAAIDIGDNDAAIGFYGRALDLDTDNRRATVGLGRAMLALGRPSEALALFEAAQNDGANLDRIAEDYGFALDLVGRHGEAQTAYAEALKDERSPALVRKLATSLAITGDAEAFEATLRPLLEQGDRSSFRTRAFGLAIMGRMGEARSIIAGMASRDLAERTYPYLDMLTRMSGAEQVAAVNLGVFHSAPTSQPRLVMDERRSSIRADERLIPQGPALARRADQTATRSDPSVAGNPESQNTVPSDPAPPQRIAVEDAFAEFADAKPPDPGPPPVPPAAAPVHPERIWVQIATGRDRTALGFDWRRLRRSAEGELDEAQAYLADWGQTNRLLTGPFATIGEANAFVNVLKGKGIDTFRYTSPEGQEIEPLP